eukprot:GILK01016712.1.p1 GENE.GILK01016712.1~~GILK01016712.1.p1  ORF type:complete len:417 (-),score=99.39 GILK01016712.1:126-1376(-)
MHSVIPIQVRVKSQVEPLSRRPTQESIRTLVQQNSKTLPVSSQHPPASPTVVTVAELKTQPATVDPVSMLPDTTGSTVTGRIIRGATDRSLLVSSSSRNLRGTSLLEFSAMQVNQINDDTIKLVRYLNRVMPDATAVSVMDRTPDSSALTASDILEESERVPYQPDNDYMRMVMQFSYVVMFSGVWPLTPLAIVANNILELRGNMFKLLKERRRPIPRTVSNIGECANLLRKECVMACPVVVGMIVFGAGQLDRYFDSCVESHAMRADVSCMDWGIRIFCFLLLEHLALLISYIIESTVSDRSNKLHKLIEDEKIVRSKVARDHALSRMSDTETERIKQLFSETDKNGSGRIDRFEMKDFFTKLFNWNREPTQSELDVIFGIMDVDEGGNISFAEAMVAYSRIRHDPVLRKLCKLD